MRCTLDPAYPGLLKISDTSTNSGDGDSTTRTAVCDPCCTSSRMVTQKGALKDVRKAGNNGFEAYRQLMPDVRNIRSGWSPRDYFIANYDLQVRFQD